MGRILKFTGSLLLVLALESCGSYANAPGYEPMTDEEIQRYRVEYYLKMEPAHRDYYEGLPTRARRDAYLRQMGLLKSKRRGKK